MDQETTRQFILDNIHLRSSNAGKKSRKKKNNAFGTICFKGFGQEASRNAPYVKVGCTEGLDEGEIAKDIGNVWTLMMDHWKMREPKLIISVTGGAKDFDYANSRLVNCFKRGLMKAATSADAWITTGGTNAGIMEIVGEAVREHMLQNGAFEQNVVVLGIVTWGVVVNKTVLRDKNNGGRFPCEYNFSNISEAPRGKHSTLLDPNHTHFVLVDSKQEEFGGEIDFRARFEDFRRTKTIREESDASGAVVVGHTVPVVLLVVEGGLNTLKAVCGALAKKTPVVIIEGFGRAADMVAVAHRMKGQDKKLSSADERELTELIGKEFQAKLSREKDSQRTTKEILNCIKHLLSEENKHLLTIFRHEDEESNHDIDEAIINAVLKANSSDIEKQLELTLAFNRCDIAKEKIFTYENNENWKKLDLNEALFKALVQDKDEFVRLLLDCGVDLRSFLSVAQLKRLYEAVLFPVQGKVAEIVKNTMRDLQQDWLSYFCCEESSVSLRGSPNLLGIISEVISRLTDDQLKGLYHGPKYVLHESGLSSRHNSLLKQKNSSGQAASIPSAEDEVGKPIPVDADQWDFERPERDLLIWSLLFNRKSLALTFWKSGRDHIGGALMASLMMKSLAHIADKEEELDLQQELIANAREFEAIATGVLNECYLKDNQTSHLLLVRDLDIWGHRSLFVLADNAEQMDFMEHTCCQSKLNKSWKGQMALTTPNYKIIICLFLPFLIHSLIKFSIQNAEETSVVPPSGNEVAPHSGGDNQFRKKQRRRRKLGKVGFFTALYYFETAPVVKFFYHTLSYLVFLGLFSFFVLTELRPDAPSVVECIVWVWALTMALDELRQILASEATTLRLKIFYYFVNSWNQFDLAVSTLLGLALVLRFALDEERFVWARMFYVTSLTLFYLRFLQTFYVSKNIGPKVIMIRRMLTDLLFFILLLGVFLIAYGVAAQALLYPGATPSWNILRNVFYMPYFNIYGEFNLDEVAGDVPNCSSNRTIYDDPSSGVPRCPEDSWLVMIFFSVYLILTNILLINLLIAMFSYTFQCVQDNSEKVWRYYRYGLINEYIEKPALVPPLIVLSLFFFLVKCVYKRRCAKKNDQNTNLGTDLRKRLDEETNRRLRAFEHAGMENYFIRRRQEEQDQMSYKVTTTGQRVEKVALDLESVKETVLATNAEPLACGGGIYPAPLSARTSTLSSALDSRDRELQKFAQKMENVESCVERVFEMIKTRMAEEDSVSSKHRHANEAFSCDSEEQAPMANSQTIIIRDFEC